MSVIFKHETNWKGHWSEGCLFCQNKRGNVLGANDLDFVAMQSNKFVDGLDEKARAC
jgi:hypothetical protein